MSHSGRSVVMRLLAVVGLALVGYPATLPAEPKSYDDCILLNVKPNATRASVLAVSRACASKFGNTPAETPGDSARELTAAEVGLIQGRAGPMFAGSGVFKGTLHNGNREIRVTETKMAIETKVRGETVTRNYRVTVDLKAGIASAVRLEFVPGDDKHFSWGLVSARGVSPEDDGGSSRAPNAVREVASRLVRERANRQSPVRPDRQLA